MYVCICHALTTEQLQCSDAASVLRRAARGRGCGTCAHRLRELLAAPRPVQDDDEHTARRRWLPKRRA